MTFQSRFNLDNGLEDNMLIFSDRAEAIRKLSREKLDSKIRTRDPDSSLSIEYKNIRALDGRIIQRFSKVGDGSIITLFDKTPYPENDNDVVCPHFVELKWANGCDFNCAFGRPVRRTAPELYDRSCWSIAARCAGDLVDGR